MTTTVYEELLERFQGQTGGASSLLMAASQKTRAILAPGTQRERMLVDVAAGVAGPVLTSYVHWVLCQAQSEGLQRLYFVSRDGQILLRIAQRLNKHLEFPIELRYLYGGRQAWHLPGLFDFTDEDMLWLLNAPEYFTVRCLFQKLQIHPEEIEQILEAEGFKRGQWDSHLTRSQIVRLRHFLQSQVLRPIILKTAKNARQNLMVYLKQEGLLDCKSWGLVDIGWFGRLQNSLGKVLESEKAYLPTGFYFALSPHACGDTFGKKLAYYRDGKKDSYLNGLSMAQMTWLEVFTAADHGLVMRYEKKGDVCSPVLKEQWNTQAINWGLVLVQKTIETFADHCARYLANKAHDVDFRPVVGALLEQWIEKPLRAEAAVWGSFQMETDQIGAYTYAVTRKINFKDIIGKLFGKELSDLTYLSWPAGCQVLTPWYTQVIFKMVRNGRAVVLLLLRRLKNVF